MTDTIQESEAALDEAVRWHDEALEFVAAYDLDAAADRAERALERFEQYDGPNSPDVANVLNARGVIAQRRGDLRLARESFERAAQIIRQLEPGKDGASSSDESHGSADEDVFPPDVTRIHVQTLNNLGQLDRELGLYDAAIGRFEEALRIARHRLGELDFDTAMLLNSIGMWCKYTGHFARGREAYGRALAILRQVCDDVNRHPQIATLYHNLGGLEHAAGEFAAAEPFARKSVEIRGRAVGTSHVDYAADVGALAAVVADLGRHDEAETLYREALAIFERVYGDDHYEIAVLLHNLAAVDTSRGNIESAWDLYQRAVAMKERWLGSQHPDLALTLHNLAVLACLRGRRDESAPLARRALAIMQRCLAESHPTRIACRELLAELNADVPDDACDSDACQSDA